MQSRPSNRISNAIPSSTINLKGAKGLSRGIPDAQECATTKDERKLRRIPRGHYSVKVRALQMEPCNRQESHFLLVSQSRRGCIGNAFHFRERRRNNKNKCGTSIRPQRVTGAPASASRDQRARRCSVCRRFCPVFFIFFTHAAVAVTAAAAADKTSPKNGIACVTQPRTRG